MSTPISKTQSISSLSMDILNEMSKDLGKALRPALKDIHNSGEYSLDISKVKVSNDHVSKFLGVKSTKILESKIKKPIKISESNEIKLINLVNKLSNLINEAKSLIKTIL
jgi:hypothetical protein